ncbi:MAG: amino acid--[acyl-carrier-protein] ligase [Polyangiaceae bacterium]
MADGTTNDSARELYEGLIKHKLIVPVGVPGAFGRGAVFEDVLARFDGLLTRLIAPDGAERMLFPPILDRQVFEKSGYLDSFPQLAGSVFSFYGDEREHAALRSRIHEGQKWDDLQKMTEVVLSPAACYPVYPCLAGEVLPENGRLVEMFNWVFRHEPSLDPTRMQAFRVREVVRVATPEIVVAWRDMWLERGVELLRSLGLDARAEVANDPFFGRAGRMLADNQRKQELKFEVVIPVVSEEKPTAVCSFNYHQTHFGESFGIRTKGGEVAHSACLGFGMERVVMALFKTHGFEVETWPEDLKKRLWS